MIAFIGIRLSLFVGFFSPSVIKTMIPKGPFSSFLLTFDRNCILNVAAFSVSAPMTTSLSSLKGPQLGETLISVKRTDMELESDGLPRWH